MQAKRNWAMSGALLLAIATGQAHAGLINGGFETGDFSGWTTIGLTSIQTAAFGTGPTEGISQASIITSDDGPSPESNETGTALIETFLSIPLGTLDPLSSQYTWDGSAIKQTFWGSKGNVLTFDWNFLTNEALALPGPQAENIFLDYAFWTLGDTQTGEVLASTQSSPFSTSGTSFDEEFGFKSVSYVLPSTGNFVLGFGAMNVGDWTVSSALIIDNVKISSATIPVPATLPLITLGLFGLSWIRPRKVQLHRYNAPEL